MTPRGFDCDLKSYRAPDAFSLLTPDEAIGWFCAIIGVGAIFADYL